MVHAFLQGLHLLLLTMQNSSCSAQYRNTFATKTAKLHDMCLQFRGVSEKALQKHNWALMRQLWFTDEPQVRTA